MNLVTSFIAILIFSSCFLLVQEQTKHSEDEKYYQWVKGV